LTTLLSSRTCAAREAAGRSCAADKVFP
jgi:hypothetical protein